LPHRRTARQRPRAHASASARRADAGGIHAGEIDGKDAGFLALREILEGKAAPGALKKVTFLFVPVFNIDGHERFGAWNRPNQARARSKWAGARRRRT